MWVLFVWLQSWQIPTAYKQVVREPILLSGHTQEAWMGYLSVRAGITHLYLHLIDTTGYEPLGRAGVCLSCGSKESVKSWHAVLGERNRLYVGWSTETTAYVCSLEGSGRVEWMTKVETPAQEIALLVHPDGGVIGLLRGEQSLLLVFWSASGELRLKQPLLAQDLPCRHARLIWGGIEGFLVIWETYTGSRWEIFLQKWLWTGKAETPARPLSQLTHSMEGMEFISDGFGGVLVVYESLSLRGAGKDLYLVRYNRNGNQVYEVPLCVEVGDQQAPKLYKRGGDLLIVWEDNRRQDWDIYYQRVEIASGRRLLPPEGIPLVALPGPQRSAHLILDYFQNEMVALWLDYRRLQGDIYLQRYTAEGMPLWEFTGRPLAANPSQQRDLRTAAQDFQLFWVAYLEDEGEKGTQPYIALLSTQGEIRLHRRLSGNFQQPFAEFRFLRAYPWKDHLLLLWSDDRDSARQFQLYLQLLNSEGKPLWSPYGLPVGPQPLLSQKNPQIHFQGDTLWCLWEGEESDVETDLFVQAFTFEGKRLFPTPLPICQAERVQTEACWLPYRNSLYVYWTDNRSMEETGFDLYIRSVSPLAPEISWRSARTFQNSAFLAKAGDTSSIHHLWQEEVNGKYQIAYALSEPGLVSNFTFLAPTEKPQRFFHAIIDSTGTLYVAFCEESFGPYEQTLRLFALSSSGSVRWQRTSPFSYPHHLYPKLYFLLSGDILLSAIGKASDGHWDLLYAIFGPEGKLRSKGKLIGPIPEKIQVQLLSLSQSFWLLLQMPSGFVLYHGFRLSELKPASLPAPCEEAYLFEWREKPFLFWTDKERRVCSLTPLSLAP
ncbi:MAG: hypothetical protein RMK19_06245 [Bacteroidia bacterium]|nr:hypothetical protein [Bacteroidia bacterium]MDW8015594.1 hypothetical protein [Bacteroidia bacterium]